MSRHQGPNQAVIREGARANQRDMETWTKISPDEARAVIDSYREAEKEITDLLAALKGVTRIVEALKITNVLGASQVQRLEFARNVIAKFEPTHS